MTLEIVMLEARALQKRDLVYIPLVTKGGPCYWCPCTNRTLGTDMYPRMPHKDYGKTVQQMPTLGKPTEGGRTDL